MFCCAIAALVWRGSWRIDHGAHGDHGADNDLQEPHAASWRGLRVAIWWPSTGPDEIEGLDLVEDGLGGGQIGVGGNDGLWVNGVRVALIWG